MSETPAPADLTRSRHRLSRAVIPLLKGPVYAEQRAETWSLVLAERIAVQEYLDTLGLELYLDEADGYAFIRQVEPPEGEGTWPRLIQRRPLGFGMSVLCLLLRKWLLQHEAGSGEARAIVPASRITEELALYLPAAKSEARLDDRIKRYIDQAVKFGLLKELTGDVERFEIQRNTRAIIDTGWLRSLDERLKQYAEHAASGEPSDD